VTEPAQIIPHHLLPRAMILLAERHIQRSMHRLDRPVAPQRFRKSLAAQVTRAEVVANIELLRAVVVDRLSRRAIDHFNVWPLLRRSKRLGDLRQKIHAAIVVAMTKFLRLGSTILKIFKIVFKWVV
jgi:hypothetical protein